MRKFSMIAVLAVFAMMMMTGTASAQEAGDTAAAAAATANWTALGEGIGVTGAVIGAGLVLLGGGRAIGNIGSSAVESIARQPEAAGPIFQNMIISAALIEGATLFGVVVALLAVL